MRRLAVPLAISVVAHLMLVALFLHLPGRFVADGQTRPEASIPSMLTLSIASGPRAPASRRTPPRLVQEEWQPIDIDTQPRLVLAPAPASSAGRSVGQDTGPGSPAPASVQGRGGSGNQGGIGSVEGSPILPIPATARRVVYLLDRSISMGPSGALSRARRELAASLRSLPPRSTFQILAYNRAIWPLVPGATGLVAADARNVASALSALDGLQAAGATDHAGALRRGLLLRPDVIHLITDADDLGDAEVLAITRANRAGTILHVVELSRLPGGTPNGALTRLALANGGRHRRVHPDR